MLWSADLRNFRFLQLFSIMGRGRKRNAKAQGQLRTEDKIKAVPAGERVLALRMHLLMLDEKTHDVTFEVGQVRIVGGVLKCIFVHLRHFKAILGEETVRRQL